jgi:uncharacterized protein YecT (DUF1311 family)
MRTISTAIVAIVLLSCGPSASGPLYQTQDCNKETNQMELNQCAQANYESADHALNDTYRRAMEAAGDQHAKDGLRDSERAWIAFRDRECARQLGPREEGGSIWPMDMANCLQEKTDARIRELRHSLDCPEGPNACAK